jgi:DNA-binding transcriptional regulator GbsR (MarR family)
MTKKTIEKLGSFAEKKKEQFVFNIQNSSAVGIIVRWLITNKLSVLLFLMLIGAQTRSFYMEREYLEQKNKNIIAEKEELINKTKELEDKLAKFEKNKSTAREINKKVKKEAENLSAKKKEAKVRELITRLKKRRAVK